MEPHRLVLCVWNDASDPASNQSWYSPEEVDEFAGKVCEVISVGWVKSETAKYLTLVADYIVLDDGTFIYGRPTKIPINTISKIEDLIATEPA
jgi:hypothetical protein